MTRAEAIEVLEESRLTFGDPLQIEAAQTLALLSGKDLECPQCNGTGECAHCQEPCTECSGQGTIEGGTGQP